MGIDLFGRRREREAALGSRLPPGQRSTDGWPVLHYGSMPRIDLATWNFEVKGLVEQATSLTWNEFTALPQTTVHCDLHCVTAWSKFDTVFTGVPARELLTH